METMIRKVQQGDANALAYIQTESWKAAFAGILDAEMLAKCTDIDRATAMYQRLLDENKGNGYLLTVNENLIALRIGMQLETLSLQERQN